MMLLYEVNSYQSQDVDDDYVELTQLINNENQIRLRCDAKSQDSIESLILLSCPLSKTGVCRENCINPCPVNESSAICNEAVTLAIPKCIYRSMSNNHIQIEYVIQLNAINEKGMWWCTFRGKRSNSVELDSHTPEERKTVATSNGNIYSNNLEINNKYENTMDGITYFDISPNLIQLIIGLVGVSVAFNIFFFIRCYAVNNYLKNLYIGHPRNNCLDQLLCIDQPRKSKPTKQKTRLNYLQSMSPPETPKLPSVKQSAITAKTNSSNTQHLSYFKSIPPSPVIYPSSQTQYTKDPYTQNQYYPKNPFHTPTVNHKAPSLEFIYDEVHNSVYTTLNSQTNDQEKIKQNTKQNDNSVGTVFNGSHWLVDPSGQIYVPYAQITPKPRRVLLSNVEYSTLRKSDVTTNPLLLNPTFETLKERNHTFGHQTISDTRHLPLIPIQTQNVNYHIINGNMSPIPNFSSVQSNTLSISQHNLIQKTPVEISELRDDKTILKKVLMNSQLLINDQLMNKITNHNHQSGIKNSDQEINNTLDSTMPKYSVKLLARKTGQPKIDNTLNNHNGSTAENYTLSGAHKIADLEDWAMIDQD
uniref:Uncharacterized protein n=1 Tax=Trichobilharzia regenti TaxID=157069 RepID=A0AA85JBE8_TRIRE|nr:unnamed protein product [Trichobilharzia regenti]